MGHSAAPSTWALLFGLALLPVLIWLVVLLFVALGLALELIHWGDLSMAREQARSSLSSLLVDDSAGLPFRCQVA
jgi:uncharacterized membrane protein